MAGDFAASTWDRLRRRFGELLREKIVPTAGGAADVDNELHHLFVALSI
ncbi:MAG: hypothetical protein ABSF34_05675 [Verrucomicrobiota bacterium]|jgi:hypothetical protein